MKNMQSSVHITESNFESKVLHSDKPVLVDFWAEWCPPCKVMNPVIEDLAQEYRDHLKVAKVNIDENADLAVRFNIRSIPTFLLFKDGKTISEIVGTISKTSLKTKLEEQLIVQHK